MIPDNVNFLSRSTLIRAISENRAFVVSRENLPDSDFMKSSEIRNKYVLHSAKSLASDLVVFEDIPGPRCGVVYARSSHYQEKLGKLF